MATASTGKTTRNGNAEKAAADFEAELIRLREEVAVLASRLAERGEDTFAAAKRVAGAGAEQLYAKGEAAVDTLKANVGDVEKQVVDAVREKPFTSLAIAAGVGFMFALLSSRR